MARRTNGVPDSSSASAGSAFRPPSLTSLSTPFSYRTAVGLHAAVPPWLLDERCSNGAATFNATCGARLHSRVNYNSTSCVNCHIKSDMHVTFTTNFNTIRHVNFHFALDEDYIGVSATSAKIGSSILVHAAFIETSLSAVCAWRELF